MSQDSKSCFGQTSLSERMSGSDNAQTSERVRSLGNRWRLLPRHYFSCLNSPYALVATSVQPLCCSLNRQPARNKKDGSVAR